MIRLECLTDYIFKRRRNISQERKKARAEKVRLEELAAKVHVPRLLGRISTERCWLDERKEGRTTPKAGGAQQKSQRLKPNKKRECPFVAPTEYFLNAVWKNYIWDSMMKIIVQCISVV